MDDHHEEDLSLTRALEGLHHQHTISDTATFNKHDERSTDINALSEASSTTSLAMNVNEETEHLPTSVAKSPLFKLPPELRNLIYSHAIMTENQIRITKSRGIPEPALLSTNKTVRLEAQGIFYSENSFLCDISHYDHATLELVSRKEHLAPMGESTQIGINAIEMSLPYEERNWNNLASWLRAFLEGNCSGFGEAVEESDPEMTLIAALFQTSWRVVRPASTEFETLLECMRPVLMAMHKDWARD